MRKPLLALIPLLWTPLLATAQSDFPLFEFDGNGAGDGFGTRVASLGDINNDGHDDIAVAAPGGEGDFGYVLVFSGLDGSKLFTFVSNAMGSGFGTGLGSVGDLNNDGFRDIGIGAPFEDFSGNLNNGRAYTFRGDNGNALNVIGGTKTDENFGISILETGDLTGNGSIDWVVGAPGNSVSGTNAGAVNVVIGAFGLVGQVFTFPNTTGFRVGSALASGGNITTATPEIDLLVGAPAAPNGRVYVVQSTGSIFNFSNGPTPNEGYGTALSGTIDHSGNGIPDLVIGSPFNDQNGIDAGRVVVSNFAGVVIKAFVGAAAGDQFGFSVANLGDVNNDTIPDLIVGSPGAGKAEVISGGDGSVIQSLVGPIGLGTSVANAGDVDGNGLVDFVVGSPQGINSLDVASGIAIVDHADPTAEPNLNLSDASEVMRIYQPGGLFPTDEVRSLENLGPTALSWEATFPPSASWLTVTPSSGLVPFSSTVPITFKVDPFGLAKSTYTTNVTFQNIHDPSDVVVVKVTLDVQDPLNTALVCVDPSGSVGIDYVLGTLTPPSIAYTLSNCGNPTKPMHWSAAAATQSGGDWLQIDATSGTKNIGDPNPVVVASVVAVSQLSPGLHVGTITVTNDDDPTDVVEIDYTLAVDVPSFVVGSELVASIDFPDDLAGGTFIGLEGMKLIFKLETAAKGLKPFVSLVDETGNEVKRWKFKGAKSGKSYKRKFKLKESGTYSLLVGSLSGAGEFSLQTDRKLPGAAKPKTHASETPKSPLSFVEVVVKALPDAVVNINATPKNATTAETFMTLFDPHGDVVDTAAYSFVSSATLHFISVPFSELGCYRVRVSGLDDPNASVTIDVAPFQPPKGMVKVSLD